jgi:hypothetical protein
MGSTGVGPPTDDDQNDNGVISGEIKNPPQNSAIIPPGFPPNAGLPGEPLSSISVAPGSPSSNQVMQQGPQEAAGSPVLMKYLLSGWE